MSENSISVGQLAAMSLEERHATVASLSPEVRRKLAHLASLGAVGAVSKAQELLGSDGALRATWVTERLAYAREHAHIASLLTCEPEDLLR